MTRNTRALPWVAAIGAISLGLAACSGGSTGGTTVPGGSGSAAAAVRGGTLNMLGAGDVDYMDPNISYYSRRLHRRCGCGAASCSPTRPRPVR